jgi:type IV pilus assembly protein PilW
MLGLDMMNNRKRSKGFSLVELLVAMVVGMIIVTGAFSLHSGTRKTQAVNEMQMDMVADARFAIEMISYDLRHAGMYGGTNKDGLIECRSTDAACSGAVPAAVTGDCVVGAGVGWAYNLSRPVFATNDSNPYSGTCILSSEGYVANTDVLDIRYADSNYLDSITGLEKVLTNGQAYVRSNYASGRVFTGATQPKIGAHDSDTNITHNYILHAFAYYVSDYTDVAGDGIPSLRRAALVNGPQVQQQTLISGVADMQVQFGENTDGDINNTIDRYVDPDQVTDWTNVYAAKIWLLMRTDKKQMGVNTKKSFSIAGAAAKTYGGQDDYRYFLVTSVVDLRNLRQI